MQQWTISQLDCDMQYKVDFIQELETINSVVGLRSSKALLKAKLAPKSHRHCLVVCCPFDPLQLSESQQNHHIWEACSANQWDAQKTAMPAVGTGQHEGPNSSPWQCQTSRHTINASKVERIGLQSFASSAIFTWPLANRLPLLQASQQLFCRENASTTSRRQKMLSKICQILKHGFFFTL